MGAGRGGGALTVMGSASMWVRPGGCQVGCNGDGWV